MSGLTTDYQGELMFSNLKNNLADLQRDEYVPPIKITDNPFAN
jgi:hypothetical protein